jgi:hypothetical protein
MVGGRERWCRGSVASAAPSAQSSRGLILLLLLPRERARRCAQSDAPPAPCPRTAAEDELALEPAIHSAHFGLPLTRDSCQNVLPEPEPEQAALQKAGTKRAAAGARRQRGAAKRAQLQRPAAATATKEGFEPLARPQPAASSGQQQAAGAAAADCTASSGVCMPALLAGGERFLQHLVAAGPEEMDRCMQWLGERNLLVMKALEAKYGKQYFAF